MTHSLSSVAAVGRKRVRASALGGCLWGFEGGGEVGSFFGLFFAAFVIAAVVPLSGSVYSLWLKQM